MRPCCLLALGSLLLISGGAEAACTVPTFQFNPERNDNVVIQGVADSGQVCTHRFAEGAGYHFTSVTVTRRPEHGSAKVTPGPTLNYAPSPNFTGKDFYQVRICATKDGQAKGCSSLFFVFTVS